jgi:hypothetical protein
MKDINCPYCNAEIDINHDDGHGYEENELHQQECNKCGKVFVFTTYISYSYTPYKAECLNGEPHDYKSTHTYPIEFTEMECTMCGERKNPTKEEMENIRGINKKVMI